jgi:hypothetical protein
MQALPRVIHPGSSEQEQTALLRQPGMPPGKQSRQSEEMAAEVGEQKLLSWSGKCTPRSGVAKEQSRVLEKTANKTKTVTRSLVRK